jgi:hypothetical protein
MPPIHNAAKAGDVQRVRAALDTGTNVNSKDHVRALRRLAQRCLRGPGLSARSARQPLTA